jgi:3-oxoacyl-[acyl-carrier-protein] synthase II
MIQRGDADAMICGGTEGAVTPMSIGGFAAMRALSTRNDEPERASRPVGSRPRRFRGRRRRRHPDTRGAGIRPPPRRSRMLAEIVGYGMSADAFHLTAPSPNGDGAFRVMRNALRDAAITPEQIDYINAHGTSTEAGDQAETAAIKRAFGDHAYKLAVSSTKSMTGHLLGGGRHRGRHQRARVARSDRAADHQPRESRRGLRSRLRPQPRAADEDRVCAFE